MDISASARAGTTARAQLLCPLNENAIAAIKLDIFVHRHHVGSFVLAVVCVDLAESGTVSGLELGGVGDVSG